MGRAGCLRRSSEEALIDPIAVGEEVEKTIINCECDEDNEGHKFGGRHVLDGIQQRTNNAVQDDGVLPGSSQLDHTKGRSVGIVPA